MQHLFSHFAFKTSPVAYKGLCLIISLSFLFSGLTEGVIAVGEGRFLAFMRFFLPGSEWTLCPYYPLPLGKAVEFHV